MKKLFLIVGLSAATLGMSVNAIQAASRINVENRKEDPKKVEIPASSLPDKITKAITDENKDSKIVKAFKLTDASGNVSGYQVTVSANGKEDTLTFDKDGNSTK